LVLAGLGLMALTALVTSRVNALYTDSAAVDANTFTTGNLDLATSPTTAAIAYSGMIPGDTVTSPLDVSNTGSTPLRYAMESTTDEDLLAAQLDLTVKVGVASCTDAGFTLTGTTLFGPDDLGSTTTDPIFGSKATGPDADDRTLAAGSSEVLCLRVALPLTSDNGYQGQTTTATFSLFAEQTINNP
jgi:hypothetical protein